MEINILQKQIHKRAMEKGFYDAPHNIGMDLMLIVSELAEALEADRNEDRCDLKAFNEVLISEQYDYATCFKKYVHNTLEDEIADAFIRLLDFAECWGIDLERHVFLKMEYNKTRPRLHAKKY